MGVSINGDNITVPGQISVQGPPTSIQHAMRKGDVASFRVVTKDVDLNLAAPADVAAITMPSSKYIPKRLVAANPSANVSAATVSLRTASGGGGTELLAPTALAALTGSGKVQAIAITTPTDQVVAAILYLRLTVAAGVAGNCDFMLESDDLADL